MFKSVKIMSVFCKILLIPLFRHLFLLFFGISLNRVSIKSTIFTAPIEEYSFFAQNTTKLIEMFKTLLFTLLIVAICVALLAIKVIIKKNGRFPNTHVGGNKEMRRRGIKCVQSQDRDARRRNPMAVNERRKD